MESALQSSLYVCDLLCVPLCPLAQYNPLDLSTRALRYLIDELDTARKSLVLCNLCRYPLDHILLADFAFGCVLQHDICSRQIFVIFVQSAHGGISNVVILEQHCFEFGRSDLEAVDLENFFCTIDNPEPTLFIVNGYIARFEKAFAVERSFCSALISPVAKMGDL